MFEESKNERWIELQFYYICADILAIRSDFMDIINIIDALTIFGKYNAEEVKQISQEALQSLRFRPIREEFCILCHHNGVNIQYIKRRALVNNRTLYNTLTKENIESRAFYPRLTSNKIKVIKEFINCFNSFKKVGIPC